MSPTARPRAVLFDLDGVLVDSYETWLGVMNEVADRFGARRIDAARLAEIFGQGIEEDRRLLFPGRSVAEIRAAYEDAMPRHLARMIANAQARPALERLRAEGLRTAIVTNTQDSLVAGILAETGMDGAVDAIAAMGDGLREKPHPDLVEAALARLGVSAAQAVLVGDSRYDEGAAEAAGVRFVLYRMRTGASLVEALAAAGILSAR